MIDETNKIITDYTNNTRSLKTDDQEITAFLVSTNEEDTLTKYYCLSESDLEFNSLTQSVLFDSTYESISEICDLKVKDDDNISLFLKELDSTNERISTTLKNGRRDCEILSNDKKNYGEKSKIANRCETDSLIFSDENRANSNEKFNSTNTAKDESRNYYVETETNFSGKCSSLLKDFEDSRSDFTDNLLIPNVYRKRGCTNLYEKLLTQIEMNDSFLSFQKLMEQQKNAEDSHSEVLQKESGKFRELVLKDLGKEIYPNLLNYKDENSKLKKNQGNRSSEISKMKPTLQKKSWKYEPEYNNKYSIITLKNYSRTSSRCSTTSESSAKQQKKYKIKKSKSFKHAESQALFKKSKKFKMLKTLTMKDLQPFQSEYSKTNYDKENTSSFLSRILKISSQETWKGLLYPIHEEETDVQTIKEVDSEEVFDEKDTETNITNTCQSSCSDIVHCTLSVLSIPKVISYRDNLHLKKTKKHYFRKRPPSPRFVKSKKMKRKLLVKKKKSVDKHPLVKTRRISSNGGGDGSLKAHSLKNMGIKRTSCTGDSSSTKLNVKRTNTLNTLQECCEDGLLKSILLKNMRFKMKDTSLTTAIKYSPKRIVRDVLKQTPKTFEETCLPAVRSKNMSSKMEGTGFVHTIIQSPKHSVLGSLKMRQTTNTLIKMKIPSMLRNSHQYFEKDATPKKIMNSNNFNKDHLKDNNKKYILINKEAKKQTSKQIKSDINKKMKYQFKRKPITYKERPVLSQNRNKVLSNLRPNHKVQNNSTTKANLLNKKVPQHVERVIYNIENKIASFLNGSHNKQENTKFFCSVENEISNVLLMLKNKNYIDRREFSTPRITTPKRLEDMKEDLDNISDELVKRLENILLYIS